MPLPSQGQALRENDVKGRFKTFYETISTPWPRRLRTYGSLEITFLWIMVP